LRTTWVSQRGADAWRQAQLISAIPNPVPAFSHPRATSAERPTPSWGKPSSELITGAGIYSGAPFPDFGRARAGGAARGVADPTDLLEVLHLSLRRFLPRFVSIHADIAAELVFASSGMMRPFPCLGRVFAEKFAADRYRRLVAGRWLDALLPAKTVGKALHRWSWRICACAVAN
jgi:hypothetical protein